MKSNQLSQSAAFITVKLYGLTRQEKFRTLFDDETIEFYEKVVQFLPAPISYYHYWLQFGWIRWMYIRSEELFLPGDLMHILARKWYISNMVDKFTSGGYEQLLVLGGGFDHQSLRLLGQGIRCVEADSPHMAKLKQTFLQEHYSKHTHPTILSMHLPDHSLGSLLKKQQILNPEKKTAIIAEGFFDYLKPETVSDVLSDINQYFFSSTIVSTHFSLDELSAFHELVFRTSLNLSREPLQFNTSMADFQQLLSEHGFTLQECIGSREVTADLLSTIDANLPMLKGFYLFKANQQC